VEHCKKIISSIFSLIAYLGKKGVCDRDLSLYKNFGIIDDKAVQLAISKLYCDPSPAQALYYQQQVITIVDPLRRWIKKNYPELLAFFDEQLKAVN
jgi:hypothetical protein